MVATAQMKFASEARPSQYIGPFGNTEPTCMPLSGHFMDIEGRVLVYQMERYQLSQTYNASWWQRAVPSTDFYNFIQYLVGLMTPPYPLQTSHVKYVIATLILK